MVRKLTLVNTLPKEDTMLPMSLVFNTDGTLMATTSYLYPVKLWKILDDREILIAELRNVTNKGGTSVAFNTDGTLITTGYRDGTIKLWSILSDNESNSINVNSIKTMNEHINMVTSITFNTEGTLLASGSYDGTVKLWGIPQDPSQSTCIMTLQINERFTAHIYSVAFNTDDTILATNSSHRIKLWNISSVNPLQVTYMTTLNDVSIESFTIRRTLLATGSDEGIIKLWRISPDRSNVDLLKTINGHRDQIKSIAFNNDSTLLATGSDDMTVKLWKIPSEDPSQLTCIETISKRRMQNNHEDDVIKFLVFNTGGTLLATISKNTIKLWRLNDGNDVENNQNNNTNLENSSSQGSRRSTVNNLNNNSSVNNNRPIYPRRIMVPEIDTNNNTNIENENNRHMRPRRNSYNNNHNISINNNENMRNMLENENENIRPAPIPIYRMNTRIIITQNLLNPNNSSNNACPNFKLLYDFIMQQNLSERFFFRYEGQNMSVIDAGGPKRDIFEKILPVYTKKFFKKIEKNDEFVILKEDVDMQTLENDTLKLILLAKAAETIISIRIDPKLLALLSSNDLMKYFSNNKKNFERLYEFINYAINNTITNYNNLGNVTNFLKNNNNTFIQRFKTASNPEIKNTIKREIRMRKFAVKCGFTTWEQLQNMYIFIQRFWFDETPSIFSCELKFDIENICKRLRIMKKINEFDPKDNIPLKKFGTLSPDKKQFDFMPIQESISKRYPFLIPFLNFIIGPESTDENRKLFIKYVAGSLSYPGELKIVLSYVTERNAGRIPFSSSTCDKKLELYKNPDIKKNAISNYIKTQLKNDKGFGRR